MATIAELKLIRRNEARLLMLENRKLQERDRIINDIKKIRRARNREKDERKAKAKKELQRIASGAKRAGGAVIRYLQRLRDSN